MITLEKRQQPTWTIYFFKISFSLYMLLTIIVLINLLIAMMSDTYHNIQSQSDTEWKYGLSKLIRKMQRIKTAPSPLNLITTWITYLNTVYKKKRFPRWITDHSHKHTESSMRKNDFPKYRLPSNNRVLPLSRTKDNFSLLQLSPTDSQRSLDNMPRINNVIDWDMIRRKYRRQLGNYIEKPS